MTLNARVLAVNGNGSINLAAGHDLLVNDSGLDPDVSTQGSGNVTATAQHSIVLGSNVQIDTAQGDISLTAINGDLTSNAQIHVNGGSGGIALAAGHNMQINDSNGGGPTPDLVVQGTGTITGTAQNAMALANNVIVQTDGGGGIGFTTVHGNLTTSARIYSEGGNGNIVLMAGNNLVLKDSGSTPDIMTTSGHSTGGNAGNPGTGQILGTANNAVVYGANFSLQTDQGWLKEISSITTLSPNIFNVFAPEIKVNGDATITGNFGDPGAHDFKLLVDWHDGTIDTYYAANPGAFQFFHHYTHFPNTIIESAPIPISVTVTSDPNIQLIGKQQVPITTIIDKGALIPGEKDLQTLGNGFFGSDAFPNLAFDALVALQNSLIAILNFNFVFPNSTEFTGPQTSNFLTFASVPGNGLGLISIDSNIQISAVHQSIAPNASNTPTGPPPQGGESLAEAGTVQTEDINSTEERQVIIEWLDENGQALTRVQVNESILDNLEELFETLKNGRFRISVIEPGETTQRTLLEFNLRGGTIAPDAEEGEKPPTIDGGTDNADQAATALPVPGDRDESPVDRIDAVRPVSGPAAADDIQARGPLSLGPFASAPPPDRDADSSEPRPHVNGTLAGAALGLGAVAAGALATDAGTGTWEERVDAALGAAEAGALSKSARLARRLRHRQKQTRTINRRWRSS
jgi:hypothetical protein